jgi:hypothetical protein
MRVSNTSGRMDLLEVASHKLRRGRLTPVFSCRGLSVVGLVILILVYLTLVHNLTPLAPVGCNT